MEIEAMRLVKALLMEEAHCTGDRANVYREPEFWQRVRAKLLTTYYTHCVTRRISPALFHGDFRDLLAMLDDAWACLASPSRAVIQQAVAALQGESKQRAKRRGARVVETAVGAGCDAAALERSIDAMLALNSLRPVATRVQKVYGLKGKVAGEFIFERVVRVFLDVQLQREVSLCQLNDG